MKWKESYQGALCHHGAEIGKAIGHRLALAAYYFDGIFSISHARVPIMLNYEPSYSIFCVILTQFKFPINYLSAWGRCPTQSSCS